MRGQKESAKLVYTKWKKSYKKAALKPISAMVFLQENFLDHQGITQSNVHLLHLLPIFGVECAD